VPVTTNPIDLTMEPSSSRNAPDMLSSDNFGDEDRIDRPATPASITLDSDLLLSAPEMITLRISRLQRKTSPSHKGRERNEFSMVLRVPADMNVDKLSFIVQKGEPGKPSMALSTVNRFNALYLRIDLVRSREFNFPGRRSPISTLWRDVYTTPVQVTSNRSCYNSVQGYRINMKQTIASFFSKAFPRSVKAKLHRDHSSGETDNTACNQVTIEKGNVPELYISFMRTIRVPVDETAYGAPPGLQFFPLYNAAAYSEDLPPAMAAQGGLLIPMYRKFSHHPKHLS
jgi:hypothetical protein